MESAMTFYQIKNKEKHFQKDLLLSVFLYRVLLRLSSAG